MSTDVMYRMCGSAGHHDVGRIPVEVRLLEQLEAPTRIQVALALRVAPQVGVNVG